jgi:hypothetical protein
VEGAKTSAVPGGAAELSQFPKKRKENSPQIHHLCEKEPESTPFPPGNSIPPQMDQCRK